MNISALSSITDYSNASPHLYTDEAAIAQKIESIALERKEQRDLALSQTDWKGRFMVASDIFNVGYMGLQGVQLATGSLSKISGVVLICSGLVGIINMIMGMISLHEASKNSSDKLQKMRLFLDGIFRTSIGTILVLVALAAKVSALAAVGTAFANPWMIPLLLVIAALPAFIEIMKREMKIFKSKDDLMLQLRELKTNLTIPATFQNIKTQSEIKRKMELIEAQWGIDVAIEAMQLWVHLLRREKEQAQKSIERLEIGRSKWKKGLHFHLVEQLLVIGSFGLSMVALSPKVNGARLNAANSFSMMGVSAIPIYPDAAWPTIRSIPLVV